MTRDPAVEEEWDIGEILASQFGRNKDDWPRMWLLSTLESGCDSAESTICIGPKCYDAWRKGIDMVSHVTGIEAHRIDEILSAKEYEWVEQMTR